MLIVHGMNQYYMTKKAGCGAFGGRRRVGGVVVAVAAWVSPAEKP